MASLAARFQLPPVARAAMTSGVVMAAGDLLCQNIQRRNNPHQKPVDIDIDWSRVRNFSVIGLTLHGPYFYAGFRALDTYLGLGQGMGNVLRKTLTGQLTLFPTYVCLFFACMGLLEGKTPPQCVEKVKTLFMPTFTSGSVFWPIANVINFRFVPSTQRVLYINAMGLIWNAFLSYVNSGEAARRAASEAAAAVASIPGDSGRQTGRAAGKQAGSGGGKQQ